MHSATTTPDHRFDPRTAAASFVTLLLAGVMLAGCRSSRPSGSMVQVTEEPAGVAATLPAPEQRLATSRIGKTEPATEMTAKAPPQQPSASGSGNENTGAIAAVGQAGDDPSVSTRRGVVSPASAKSVVTASEGDGEDQPASTPSAGATAPQPASTATSGLASRSAESASLPESPSAQADGMMDANSADENSADETVAELVSASLTDLSTPMTNAQKPQVDSPAEAAEAEAVVDGGSDEAMPQRRALRKPAPLNTGQPNGLDAAIAGSIENLPNLPAASELEQEGPPPTRIGQAREERDREVMEFKGDREPQIAMNADRVKPVSHADEAEPLGSPKPVKRRAASDVETSPSVKQWTDQELYEELLTRVSEIPEGDNATERERRQIIARYLMVLAGDPDSAVAAMDGLNADEQQSLKNHLLGLWTLIDPQGHPSSGRRITEALPRYRQAVHHMAAATDSLALANLEFCTEIEAYGQIKPFSGNRFNAGQQVIVYCEVENFAAAEQDGVYRTRLQGSYDIYDASGTKVFSQLLPLDEQESRNRLRDYFVAYQMNLPNQLSPGTYRLQLTVEDLVGKKYGQSNIPFEIR